jgi:hypothetical protein
VQFIDRNTNNNSSDEIPQIFGEGVGAEDPGVEYLNQFSDRDWWQLKSYWRSQSDEWIELLILLLGYICNPNSEEILVNIVLLGSDNSRVHAMENLHDRVIPYNSATP